MLESQLSAFLRNLRMMQINNAGSNAYSYKPLAEASDEDLLYASDLIYSISTLSLYMPWIFYDLLASVFENFAQRSCHYKYAWFDDMLPRGEFSF